MIEDWGVFNREQNEEPAVVSIDFALLPDAPLATYPMLGSVRIPLHEPRPDGLPTGAESDALAPLEEELHQSLRLEGARLVARVWHGGCRDLYFYAPPGAEFQAWVDKVCGHWKYDVKAEVRPDPQWELFDSLSPSAWETQVVSNHQVISHMLDSGDDLVSEREVDHFLYFPTEAARQQALDAATAHRFTVVQLTDDEAPPHPWGMQLMRRDAITPEAITPPVRLLFELTQELKGDYDGWGSPIIRR